MDQIDWRKMEQEMRLKARFYAQKSWGVKFDIPVILDGRLQTRAGSLFIDKNKNPEKIVIAKRLFDQYHQKYHADAVLLHELCHLYCFISGKSYRDGDADFENEINKIGSVSTKKQYMPCKLFTANCENCGNTVCKVTSKRRYEKYISDKSYLSKCCNASLIQGGEEVVVDGFIPDPKLISLVEEFEEQVDRIH